MTLHTAFVDPIARPDAPERQSIECRAFLFFTDSEPTTCPALSSDAVAESVDLVENDAEVEAAVEKTLGLIDTMSSWRGFAVLPVAWTRLCTMVAPIDGTSISGEFFTKTARKLVHDGSPEANLTVPKGNVCDSHPKGCRQNLLRVVVHKTSDGG